VEGDFEHQAPIRLPHRAEPVYGMGADMAVDLTQLLVGEAEVGFPNWQKLGTGVWVAVPTTERVVRIEARPLSAATLGVHQDAIDQQRIALPLVPQSSSATGDIGAVTTLEHQSLNRFVPRACANLCQVLEMVRINHG